MHIFLDCIPCFTRQALDAARLATDDKKIHEQVLRKVLALAKDLDMSQSPPVMGQKIHRLIRELVGAVDPYRDVKRRFNNAALKLYPKMREHMANYRKASLKRLLANVWLLNLIVFNPASLSRH